MKTNDIARIAALVGEPARAAMLLELMDGRALTANELARSAGISAQTASRHLGLMVEAGLMRVSPRGRHRYHTLASADVARVLEGIMQIAGQVGCGRPGEAAAALAARQPIVVGPRADQLRMARMCYDHVAGRLGLAITERLLLDGAIAFDGESGQVNERAGEVLRRWGLQLETSGAPASGSPMGRPYCRPCLDWSERKAHLAGRLGALICAHCLQSGWLTRAAGARALSLTPDGATRLRGLLGLALWERVVGAGGEPIAA